MSISDSAHPAPVLPGFREGIGEEPLRLRVFRRAHTHVRKRLLQPTRKQLRWTQELTTYYIFMKQNLYRKLKKKSKKCRFKFKCMSLHFTASSPFPLLKIFILALAQKLQSFKNIFCSNTFFRNNKKYSKCKDKPHGDVWQTPLELITVILKLIYIVENYRKVLSLLFLITFSPIVDLPIPRFYLISENQ